MNIKALIVGVFLLGLTFLGAQERPNVVTPASIALIQVVEHPALDATRQGILDELKAQGYEPGKNLKWMYESAQNSPLLASQIAQKFAYNKPDMIVALGTLAAQSAIKPTRASNIPLVFSSVTDPLGAGLIASLEKPGAHVTGVSNLVAVIPQFMVFQDIIPALYTIGIIYNPGEPNSVKMVELCKEAAENLDLRLITAVADKSIDVGTAAQRLIAQGTDVLFVTNDNTALSAFSTIIKIATEQGIPVFCSDTDYVKLGALAALGPNQYKHGRQTGRLIMRILKGESTAKIAVEFPQNTELVLNGKMAKTLGILLPIQLLEQAAAIEE